MYVDFGVVKRCILLGQVSTGEAYFRCFLYRRQPNEEHSRIGGRHDGKLKADMWSLITAIINLFGLYNLARSSRSKELLGGYA